MADAQACATLLLDTIPSLMRRVAGGMRHARVIDEPPTPEQFRLIAMLSHHPCSLNELAAGHHVTPSTMSRSVEVLVRRGWITRERDLGDRRQVILRATEAGRTAFEAVRVHMEERIAAVLDGLSPAEQTRLYDGIAVLHRLVTQLDEREPLPSFELDCPFPGAKAGDVLDTAAASPSAI